MRFKRQTETKCLVFYKPVFLTNVKKSVSSPKRVETLKGFQQRDCHDEICFGGWPLVKSLAKLLLGEFNVR